MIQPGVLKYKEHRVGAFTICFIIQGNMLSRGTTRHVNTCWGKGGLSKARKIRRNDDLCRVAHQLNL